MTTNLELLMLFAAYYASVTAAWGLGFSSLSVNRDRRRRTKTTMTRLQAKPKQPKWITCASTNELVDAVKTQVRPNDVVVEIGSQLRQVSTEICQQLQDGGGQAILMDVARKTPKNTSDADRTKAMRYPGEEANFFTDVATFVEMQSLEEWRTALLEQKETTTTYDVLVLDLNNIVGNDLDLSTVAILKEFDALFPNYRVILVKSLSLNQWAAKLVHAPKWIHQKGQHDDIPPPHIVGTVGVQEYRNTIPFTVHSGDAVLDVGCHFGTSTVLLHRAASPHGYALGVDVGPKIIADAQQRHPEVTFVVGDAWKTASLLRIQVKHCHAKQQQQQQQQQQVKIGFDVIFVDVGGLSGSDGLLEALSMLSALMNALEPRTIVIKSLCISRLSSRLVPYWQLRKARSP